MIYGIGTDITKLARMEKVITAHPRFVDRFFSRREIGLSESRGDEVAFFSGRFAGKEAVAKALGTGFSRGVTWQDIEILADHDHKPVVYLKNMAQKIQKDSQISRIHISISHEKEYAVAFCIMEGE